MAEARWNGKVIAKSDDTKVVEGNRYFPRASVNSDFLKSSNTQSTCPWKGVASYHTIVVDGQENKDAAWFYPNPLPEADKLGIKDHLAFWNGVEIS